MSKVVTEVSVDIRDGLTGRAIKDQWGRPQERQKYKKLSLWFSKYG